MTYSKIHDVPKMRATYSKVLGESKSPRKHAQNCKRGKSRIEYSKNPLKVNQG